MRDLVVTRTFMQEGGSELAPMSTTTDLRVALEYTRMEQGSRDSGAALLFRVLVSNMMQRGADLEYLSVKPSEKEYLYPPLTFLKPTGGVVDVQHEGVLYTVIDVVPFFPS